MIVDNQHATVNVPIRRGRSYVSDARAEIVQIAHETLAEYAANPGSSSRCGQDAGPMVLAASLVSLEAKFKPTADSALGRWVAELPEEVCGVGAFGGLGGFLAGLRAALQFSEKVESIYHALCAQTEGWLSRVEWRSSQVAWEDYDFFMGPAGVIIGGASEDCDYKMFQPALHHLTSMCEDPSLESFRAGENIDPRSAFNIGRINTGLGHGLAGVATALHHATRVLKAPAECLQSLRRVCDWLARESFLDPRGLVTWPPVGADGQSRVVGFGRRQAWCYGTPGISWTLWDSSRTLRDASLETLARVAMETFCRAFDEDLYIDPGPASEALTICHGAAGTLAVADSFFCHAGVEDADRIRARLIGFLLDRSTEIRALGATDMSILSGAAGIMAVLLTACGGDRRWLHQIALR
jgi:hypothetical protein